MRATPRKEHEWLRRLVGEWRYEVDMPEPGKPPERLTGTESVRALGGLWVLAEGRGQMPGGGEATTLMTLGYDPQQGRYTGTWIGSMMTHLWIYDGHLDEEGRVLALDAEGPRMDGGSGTSLYRDQIELEGDDRRILRALVRRDDGQWEEMMEARYRRVG